MSLLFWSKTVHFPSPGYRITAATCDLPFGAFCCCSRLPAQINLGSSKIQSLPNWSSQNALLLLDSYPRSDIKDEILTVMHWTGNRVCWCVGPKMINSLNPCCLRFLSHCCPQKTVLMGTFKFPGSIILSCILSLYKWLPLTYLWCILFCLSQMSHQFQFIVFLPANFFWQKMFWC